MLKTENRLLEFAGIALLIAIVLWNGWSFASAVRHNSFSWPSAGADDFLQYWSAARIAARGENPYDSSLMHAEQKLVAPDIATPVLFWNPPSMLLILQPLHSLEFSRAARYWCILSGLLWIASFFFLVNAFEMDFRRGLWFAAWASSYPPFWNSLSFGQMTPLLGWAAAGMLWALVRQKFYWLGLFASVLAFKIHLVHLLVVALLWWLVRTRRFATLVSILLWALASVGSTYLVYPHAFFDWYNSIFHPSQIPQHIHLGNWVGATLAGLVRLALEDWFGIHTIRARLVIPVVTDLVFLYYCIREHPRFDWRRVLPPLMAISLITAPYGWHFDCCIAVMLVALIVDNLARMDMRQPGVVVFAATLAGVYLLTFYFLNGAASFQHQMAWFPMALVIVWWFQLRVFRDPTSRIRERVSAAQC